MSGGGPYWLQLWELRLGEFFCLADEKPNPDKLDPQVLPKLFELWRRGMLSNTNNSPFDSTA
jgi:hypothetical protein